MDINLLNEILGLWEMVKADRLRARECLMNTGPGESPFNKATQQLWQTRVRSLEDALLSAMPDIEPLILAALSQSLVERFGPENYAADEMEKTNSMLRPAVIGRFTQRHTHVTRQGTTGEYDRICAVCGRDLTDPLHFREGETQ